MNTLLYLLYGEDEQFHLELTYSVLTAIARNGTANDFRIVLACDEHVRRDDLPVAHLAFSREELLGWTFGGRFNHGAKIGALSKAAASYEGKLALLDTDTFFLRNPSELFGRIDDQNVVMHRDEGPLGQYGDIGSYRRLMENYSGPYAFDETTHMFNSGVVGVRDRASQLLVDVASLTKDLVDLSTTPLHTLEQFSFGNVFGRHLHVKTCDDLVRHYTGWKRRFVHQQIKEIIPEFTSAAFNAALANSREVEVLPRKRKTDLVRSRIKAWQRPGLNDFAFAYICYLSAFNARSRAEANAWAGTALDFITYNDYPREVVLADFRALGSDRLADTDWLDSSTRNRWAAYWRADLTTTSPASQ